MSMLALSNRPRMNLTSIKMLSGQIVGSDERLTKMSSYRDNSCPFAIYIINWYCTYSFIDAYTDM